MSCHKNSKSYFSGRNILFIYRHSKQYEINLIKRGIKTLLLTREPGHFIGSKAVNFMTMVIFWNK